MPPFVPALSRLELSLTCFALEQDEEDSTIWHVPLQILSVDQKTGETKVDSSAFLTERETSFKLPEGPWKLNAGSLGVCGSSDQF